MKINLLGSGYMGKQICSLFVILGYDVVIWQNSTENLDDFLKNEIKNGGHRTKFRKIRHIRNCLLGHCCRFLGDWKTIFALRGFNYNEEGMHIHSLIYCFIFPFLLCLGWTFFRRQIILEKSNSKTYRAKLPQLQKYK